MVSKATFLNLKEILGDKKRVPVLKRYVVNLTEDVLNLQYNDVLITQEQFVELNSMHNVVVVIPDAYVLNVGQLRTLVQMLEFNKSIGILMYVANTFTEYTSEELVDLLEKLVSNKNTII